MSVLIYIEHEEGVVKKSSLEAVSYGKSLAESLGTEALVVGLGSISPDEWTLVGHAGASKGYHVTDERLNAGIIQAHTAAVSEVFEHSGADVLVLAKSSLGDAVAARLSVKLQAALVSNVVSLPDLAEGFKVKRSIFTGKAFAITAVQTSKKILAIKKNILEIRQDATDIAVEEFTVSLVDRVFAAKITGTDKAEGEISLPEADIVVSGGRGMKGPENWGIIEDLAKALGAATGCSKPVSDLNWRPHHEHVGQTGIKVSPSLYVAVGISGAIQHLAGVNASKNILVINKDPEAPFFKAADYGIVGDAFEVLPKLTEAIKAIK
ncbi:electron transfer flavoprotein subunit alpha/FixB family protein [Lunatibacter salilacus]|uniref:electron transfer flavoprotein subunit alpha/FixB family protein n=1 Tax=Lunatibacter salilacus TaxID=2483804 RepID=UPI00131CEE11|nr:electron transfer flavoprotein subunit alpha/FixB family protein [Lunatibacter salilacus]